MNITDEELLEKLRVAIKDEGGVVIKWAQKHGIPRRSVDMALKGHRRITPEIAKVLGYTRNIRTWTLDLTK